MTEAESPTTARLVLRPFRVEDIAALNAIFADARAMQFWSTPPHQGIGETERFVRNTIAATESGRGDDFIVLLDGEVIGKAGLWNNVEIGFIFAPRVWGMGIASEAVQAVMARANQRGVARVTADVDPRNARCISLLANHGFVLTGTEKNTLQVGGAWVDSAYYEWRSGR